METERRRIYKLTVMIVDHDDLGFQEVGYALENGRFPNRCIMPIVVAQEEQEVDWDDEHPLNQKGEVGIQAFNQLFSR